MFLLAIFVSTNLQIVACRHTRHRLGNFSLESSRSASKFGHFLSAFSLFGVMLRYAILFEASERNFLQQRFGFDGLTSGGALSYGLFGNANLTRTPDNGMLQNSTLSILSFQRLGNLKKIKMRKKSLDFLKIYLLIFFHNEIHHEETFDH